MREFQSPWVLSGAFIGLSIEMLRVYVTEGEAGGERVIEEAWKERGANPGWEQGQSRGS